MSIKEEIKDIIDEHLGDINAQMIDAAAESIANLNIDDLDDDIRKLEDIVDSLEDDVDELKRMNSKAWDYSKDIESHLVKLNERVKVLEHPPVWISFKMLAKSLFVAKA